MIKSVRLRPPRPDQKTNIGMIGNKMANFDIMQVYSIFQQSFLVFKGLSLNLFMTLGGQRVFFSFLGVKLVEKHWDLRLALWTVNFY